MESHWISETENETEWREAVNMNILQEKAREPQKDSEIVKAAIPTTRRECEGWQARLPPRPFQRCQVGGPLQNTAWMVLQGSQKCRAAQVIPGDDTTTPVSPDGRTTSPLGLEGTVSNQRGLFLSLKI